MKIINNMIYEYLDILNRGILKLYTYIPNISLNEHKNTLITDIQIQIVIYLVLLI